MQSPAKIIIKYYIIKVVRISSSQNRSGFEKTRETDAPRRLSLFRLSVLDEDVYFILSGKLYIYDRVTIRD